MPKISVGILTFNRREEVATAIDSVYRQGFSDLEVVVVDSASSDGTAEMIRERFPDVKYIRLPRNLGCPGGRNHIYANCSGEYIVNLDDDGWLEETSLARMNAAMDRHPDVGILSIRQAYPDEGELALRDLDSALSADGEDYAETGLFRGGLSVFRKTMLDEIGVYPEEFFLYAEESHLSIRAMSAGYKILSAPDIVMWHPRLGGSGSQGASFNYYRARNELLTIVDLYPASKMPGHLVHRAAAHGRWAIVNRTLGAYARALAFVLTSLPARLRNRTPASWSAIRRYLDSRPPAA